MLITFIGINFSGFEPAQKLIPHKKPAIWYDDCQLYLLCTCDLTASTC